MTAPDLSSIRARAVAHQQAIDEPRWLSVSQLAHRYGVSSTTVRAIPFDELPYKEFGRGLKLKRRRYHPKDVEVYESRPGRPGRAS